MQLHTSFTNGKVREDCRLGKPIGLKVLHILGAVVTLIQMNEEFARIYDILLALAGIKRRCLHPDQQRYNLSSTLPRWVCYYLNSNTEYCW